MTKALRHILYVDDDPNIQEVAQMCLEVVGGFQVTCLNSGAEVIEKAKAIDPDLILLDVMMPHMDGPTTLKMLLAQPEFMTPVVFMTARVQPEDITKYLQLGAAGVVPKPFDPMLISDQINKIWEGLNGIQE